jgi:hypothetical protein
MSASNYSVEHRLALGLLSLGSVCAEQGGLYPPGPHPLIFSLPPASSARPSVCFIPLSTRSLRSSSFGETPDSYRLHIVLQACNGPVLPSAILSLVPTRHLLYFPVVVYHTSYNHLPRFSPTYSESLTSYYHHHMVR